MGFKCTICKMDFGTDKAKMFAHYKEVHDIDIKELLAMYGDTEIKEVIK